MAGAAQLRPQVASAGRTSGLWRNSGSAGVAREATGRPLERYAWDSAPPKIAWLAVQTYLPLIRIFERRTRDGISNVESVRAGDRSVEAKRRIVRKEARERVGNVAAMRWKNRSAVEASGLTRQRTRERPPEGRPLIDASKLAGRRLCCCCCARAG